MLWIMIIHFHKKKNKNKNDKNMYAYIFHSNECLHDTCIMTVCKLSTITIKKCSDWLIIHILHFYIHRNIQ